jgi:hypothetical protein
LHPIIVTEEPLKAKRWNGDVTDQDTEGEASSGCHWHDGDSCSSGDDGGHDDDDDDDDWEEGDKHGQEPLYEEDSRENETLMRAARNTEGNASFGLDAVNVKSTAAVMITIPEEEDGDGNSEGEAGADAGAEQQAVSCASQGVRSTCISCTISGRVGKLLFCFRPK